jgi:para-aminobenzoate synthetase component I
VDRARFADRRAHGVVDIRHGHDALEAISHGGFWAVVATFEGTVTAVRFAVVEPLRPPGTAPQWTPLGGTWTSSLDEPAYLSAVVEVRDRIAAGFVYQVNVCRVLQHELSEDADLDGLDVLVRQGNPSPHGSRVRCHAAGIDLVCASPELYLRRAGGRLVTRPIKGTATTPELMLPKDHAENVMIVDMARNDLGQVASTGSVRVTGLCEVEDYPGLVQLVSTVRATVPRDTGWSELFAATFPPASVSGAPKSSALRLIAELEPVPRGPYCGAVGFVDGDRGEGVLAVGIRTFWLDGDELRFGTGAGITWGSDAQSEWAETELKAERLIAAASGPAVEPVPSG